MAGAAADPKPRNPALRLLGLPRLPSKLPSRNWLIFWTLSTSLSAAIIYDRREKRRATARWAAAVSHLAKEPIASPSAMPRRLTVYLQAPPGDGLRVAQDHFAEYVKPVLAASGMDWEFVVGRREGDVRAVIAERTRRGRRAVERDVGGEGKGMEEAMTEEDAIEAVRRRNGIPDYTGVKGDVVVGRHTWKEYVRGLHEGWLGPLAAPPEEDVTAPAEVQQAESEEESKPKPPPQPRPHNTPEQYPSSPLPLFTPAELTPTATIPFPHVLGFLSTPTRMRRFLGRRYLADEIGREVAAVCLCSYREYRESEDGYEQQAALTSAERDWIKSVWKDDPPPKASEGAKDGDEMKKKPEAPKEKIWASPMVLDSRIAGRMRRFDVSPEDMDRAGRIVVPEEEIEGWIKGSLRHMWRWGARQWQGEQLKVNLGNPDDTD